MYKTRLSSKGQLILPKAIRDAMGWGSGVDFIVLEKDGEIILRPIGVSSGQTFDKLLGCINYKGPKKTFNEMDQAISKGFKNAKH